MDREIIVSTHKKRELISITSLIQQEIDRQKFREGLIYLFLPHATAGFWLNEDEERLKADVLEFFQRLTESADWRHNRIDDNAEAHLLSGLLKPYLLLAVQNQKLILGTWQEVFLVELDGPRERTIQLHFIQT